MNKTIKSGLRIGLLFMVVMTLVLSSSLPVLAKNTSKPVLTSKPVSTLRVVQGEVVSISSDNSTSDNATIVVRNGSQQLVTFKVDANTKYYMAPNGKTSASPANVPVKAAGLVESVGTANCGIDPNSLGRYGKQAQFSDIQVGDKVVAWVKTADNIATKILIIKPPVIQKVKGTITAISDNSTTITPLNGNAVTLNWDGNTKFVLKGLISVQTGQYAAAVYNRTTMLALTVNVQATAPASDESSD
jgi:hypothetical protein